jgi:hypothetical protein
MIDISFPAATWLICSSKLSNIVFPQGARAGVEPSLARPQYCFDSEEKHRQRMSAPSAFCCIAFLPQSASTETAIVL